MAAAVPYSSLLGTTDPLVALESTPNRIAALVSGWDEARWASTYAPGKWSASQIVLHLLHDEISWPDRIRYLLTEPRFRIHAYDGGRRVALESPTEPHTALSAFLALRRLNLLLYRRLTPEQRAASISHPEFGRITVEWILRVLAGHDLHHLGHLEAIARSPVRG